MCRSSQAAFTRIELAAVILVLIVLASLLSAREQHAHKERQQQTCINNLKHIGLAYRIWSTGDEFPFEASTNDGGTKEFPHVWQHFQILSNELSTPQLLVCPSGPKVPAKNWKSLTDANVSYFEGESAQDTFPQSFLSGDSGFVLAGASPESNPIELTKDSDISYPASVHRGIAIICMGDGSVQRFNSDSLKLQQKNTGLETNVVLLPK